MTISAERVRELFDYDEAGHLMWRVSRGTVRAGKRAGTVDKGYIYIQADRRAHCAHRLIFLWHHGWLPEEIDHINRNGLDNRIENLRAILPMHNVWHSDHGGGSDFHKASGKWRATIQEAGVKRFLGHFDTEEESRAAYRAARELRNAAIRPLDAAIRETKP
jgi:HNH endonuclease